MDRQPEIIPRDQLNGRSLPLKLRRVTIELKVSTRQLGGLVGLSAGSISLLASHGHFPKRCEPEKLRERIRNALRELGATPEQLEDLFEHYSPFIKGPRTTALPPPERVERKPRIRKSDPPEEEPMLSPKQTLTDDARKAFGLFSNPFDGEVITQDQMFMNGEIRFVREAAWQAAINGRFVAVVGESGAGKSTVLADLKERIMLDRKPVIMIEPSVVGMAENDSVGKTLKLADIQTALVMTLDPGSPVLQTSEKRTRQVLKLLEHSAMAGNVHLLLIEEAHALPVPTFNQLKRLHEKMRLGRRPLLGILLLAHERELRVKLNRYDTREVMQRCEIARLPPLGGSLRGYLEHRAKVAGFKLDQFITPEGLDELQSRMTVDRHDGTVSLLYPLNVNNWMTAALNTAASLGAPRVDRDVVRAV